MRKTKRSKLVVPDLPTDGFHEYMAIGNQCWARGPTAAKAQKGLSKISGFPAVKILVVPKGAWIDEIGRQILWRVNEAGDIHKDGACELCKTS